MKYFNKKVLSTALAALVLATSLPAMTFAQPEQPKDDSPVVQGKDEEQPDKNKTEEEKPEEKPEDKPEQPEEKPEQPEEKPTEEKPEEQPTEEKPEAEGFSPEIRKQKVEQKGSLNLKDSITNLPKDATVEVLKDIDTIKLGRQIGQLLITFKDGSTLKVDVPVDVVEKKVETVLITFDPMKGKVKESSRRIEKNTEVGKLPTPTREKHVFEGWFLDKNYKTPLKATTKFDKDTTVYAKWAEEVDVVESRHIAYIVGYPDGTFRPQGNVTRAEAAQMFATLLNGSNTFVTSRSTKFSDADNQWFSQAVNYVVEEGMISGYEDGTFRPNENITRAEFAQMISGMVDKMAKKDSTFTDVKDHWAKDAIETVFGAKKVSGYPDGTFRPNRDISRAEAVTIFNAVFNRVTNGKSFKNVVIGNLNRFSDVQSDHWAYYQILDAANGHVSNRTHEGYDLWK